MKKTHQPSNKIVDPPNNNNKAVDIEDEVLVKKLNRKSTTPLVSSNSKKIKPLPDTSPPNSPLSSEKDYVGSSSGNEVTTPPKRKQTSPTIPSKPSKKPVNATKKSRSEPEEPTDTSFDKPQKSEVESGDLGTELIILPSLLFLGSTGLKQDYELSLNMHFAVQKNGKFYFLCTLLSSPPLHMHTEFFKYQKDKDSNATIELVNTWNFTRWFDLDTLVQLFHAYAIEYQKNYYIRIANRLRTIEKSQMVWANLKKPNAKYVFDNPPFLSLDSHQKSNLFWNSDRTPNLELAPPNWVSKLLLSSETQSTKKQLFGSIEISPEKEKMALRTYYDMMHFECEKIGKAMWEGLFQERIIACGEVPSAEALKALQESFSFIAAGTRKSLQGRPSSGNIVKLSLSTDGSQVNKEMVQYLREGKPSNTGANNNNSQKDDVQDTSQNLNNNNNGNDNNTHLPMIISNITTEQDDAAFRTPSIQSLLGVMQQFPTQQQQSMQPQITPNQPRTTSTSKVPRPSDIITNFGDFAKSPMFPSSF